MQVSQEQLTTVAAPEHGDLRETLSALRRDKVLTFAEVEKATGISRPTISMFASGNRLLTDEKQELIWAFVTQRMAGNTDASEIESAFIPAPAKPEPVGGDVGVYKTKEFQVALGWCEFIRRERKMGAMIGYPGIGKTTIIRHYAATTPGVQLLEAWPSMRMQDFLNMLARSIGIVLRGNTFERELQMVQHLKGRDDMMLIVDEAEYLRTWDVTKFEVLRKIWDNTGTPIILCGTPELESILRRGSGRENLAQLYRRQMEITLKGITRQEVCEILGWHSVDPDAAALLTTVALKVEQGGMGTFCEILRMCLKTAQGQRITVATVESAMRFKLMY